MHKKILILGDGFIGKNLYKYFSTIYDTTISNKSILNIANKTTINYFFDNNKFDYIIYAIGIKDVKKCEKFPELAYNINAYYINNILSNINNNKFIYISTDYVFDGQDGNYDETSFCNPKTVYGKSKLLGENICLTHSNSLVVRTSGVYGSGCLWLNNLLHTLDNNSNITCFSDIYNSPTYAINLAEMIDDMIKVNYAGIINLNGDTKSNRYDLYKTIATIYGKNTDLLLNGKSDGNFPRDISLNNTLYKSLMNKIPNSIQTGINRFKNEY